MQPWDKNRDRLQPRVEAPDFARMTREQLYLLGLIAPSQRTRDDARAELAARELRDWRARARAS